MSYPPQGGYGYPPQPNPGYPSQQPYQQPGAQPNMGIRFNQQGGPGMMPMPGAPGYGPTPGGAPSYGPGPGTAVPYPTAGGMPMPGSNPPYGQPQPNPPYGQPQPNPPHGQPQPNPPYGQPQPSFHGMAYAATAAVNFRPGGYPQQPYGDAPQQPYPGGQPPQSQQPHHGGQQPYPGGQQPYPGGQQPYPGGQQPPYSGTSPQRPAPPLNTPQSLPKQNVAPKEPPTQGTVKDVQPFNAQQDAEVLRKAMKGLGTDEKAVTHIISSRSNAQRQRIKLEFATIYGKDLIKELKSELSGNYETTVLALLMPPDECNAYQLFSAMKGLGTDEKALIETLCSRTNAEIRAASEAFRRLYKKDLEKEIYSETSGHFRRLLVSLVQGSRMENEALDHRKAVEDAHALYKAGEARWGTDESRFNVVLAARSFPQLRLTFDEYRKISKRTMEQAISSEMSGDLKDGMLAVVKCSRNRASFFAERLYWSMKGLGTDDKTLIRIMVSRSEIDMVQIKNEFRNMYGKTLASFISEDCSGDYKKILIQLCGGNN